MPDPSNALSQQDPTGCWTICMQHCYHLETCHPCNQTCQKDTLKDGCRAHQLLFPLRFWATVCGILDLCLSSLVMQEVAMLFLSVSFQLLWTCMHRVSLTTTHLHPALVSVHLKAHHILSFGFCLCTYEFSSCCWPPQSPLISRSWGYLDAPSLWLHVLHVHGLHDQLPPDIDLTRNCSTHAIGHACFPDLLVLGSASPSILQDHWLLPLENLHIVCVDLQLTLLAPTSHSH